MEENRIQTDILCIGGGIAGLMGAIRAGEMGVKVVLADKGNTVHSGAGATGNDHFFCYIPEVHGPDVDIVTHEYQRTRGGIRSDQFVRAWFEKTFEIVKLWESWGIPMKCHGEYDFAGHGIPGKPLIQLKYGGHEQKRVLTREAQKRGIKILNRTPLFDLFKEGALFTAIGINTKGDQIIIIHAKSVLIATGQCIRLYPSPTPAWMFNLAWPPHNTGDGRAMAYRAGAELVGIEMPRRWVGPKYFARCGRATWVGVLRDHIGKPIGPFVTKPDRRYGDATADVYGSLFDDFRRSGRGPVFMDCRGISDEDYEYMMHWMKHEGLSSLTDHFKDEGIDLRKHPVEFTTYELLPAGGIYFNEKGETSLPGLYAAGDELFGGGGISCAATIGYIAGKNAVEFAKSIKEGEGEQPSSRVEEWKKSAQSILARKDGPDWKEVNAALQQIMNDYAGLIRSQSLLEAGLVYLGRLKGKATKAMKGDNAHELMHCLEVLNLLDLGELIFNVALERNESRRLHNRVDYPYTNPLMEKLIFIKKAGDTAKIDWREINF